MEYPSCEKLFEYFIPNYVDGYLIRRKKSGYRGTIGDIIRGTKQKKLGHITIKFNGKNFYLHRILWIMYYGSIDEKLLIDHIDGNASNNNISNLRLATYSNNNHNEKLNIMNTTGHKDICLYSKTKKGKVYWYYRVSVKLNSKATTKNFPENKLEDAIKFRDDLILKLHGEFGRLF